MITENGWPDCDFADLDFNPIPGTDVKIGLQRGWPNIILKAFAADLNWYVESVYNSRGGADEGGWTQFNSVPTSNHLGGTAFDYNWFDHPMGIALDGWHGSEIRPNQEQEPFVRDLLRYYTYKGLQLVWWANDWNTPKDSMHFQMGYNTYGDPRVQEFIDQFIDPATGFSRFREDHGMPGVDLVATLAEAMGNRAGVDYARYLPYVQDCLVQCNCTTLQRSSMWFAQVGTESGGLQWMREIASGAEYEGNEQLGNTQPGDGVRFAGRGPIQVTGRDNYTDLSQWAFELGMVPTPTYFVDHPEKLEEDRYGFIGVTWYWTTQRPMNDAADAGNVELATRYVNGGNHGLPDRKFRYANCMNMGDRLLALTTNREDDWMSQVNVDRLNLAIDKILGGGSMPESWGSRGMFMLAGEKSTKVDDTIGMLLNTDGNVWNLDVIVGILIGHPEDVQRCKDTANGLFPEDSFVEGNEWLKERAISFASLLLPMAGSFAKFFTAVNESASAAIQPTENQGGNDGSA